MTTTLTGTADTSALAPKELDVPQYVFPYQFSIEDVNEIQVLFNSLEKLAEDLPEKDEDQAVISRLLIKLGGIG